MSGRASERPGGPAATSAGSHGVGEQQQQRRATRRRQSAPQRECRARPACCLLPGAYVTQGQWIDCSSAQSRAHRRQHTDVNQPCRRRCLPAAPPLPPAPPLRPPPAGPPPAAAAAGAPCAGRSTAGPCHTGSLRCRRRPPARAAHRGGGQAVRVRMVSSQRRRAPRGDASHIPCTCTHTPWWSLLPAAGRPPCPGRATAARVSALAAGRPPGAAAPAGDGSSSGQLD